MEPLGKKFRGAFGGVGPGVLSSGLWGCSHRVFGADRVLDTGYIYISSYCRMYPETALKLLRHLQKCFFQLSTATL